MGGGTVCSRDFYVLCSSVIQKESEKVCVCVCVLAELLQVWCHRCNRLW